MIDTFKTIKTPSKETLFKDKNSKFYGFAFPVTNEENVKIILNDLKKKHPNAGHYCYAYKIGLSNFKYRFNDDGEPNNTAGLPIYGQIKSFDVTNILIVSIRYFGGVKLGVSGLVSAYRNSAKITLEESDIVENIIEVFFQLNFKYEVMNRVMKIIKEKNIKIVNQKLELDCEYKISVRKNDADSIFRIFNTSHKIDILKLESHFD